MRAILPIWRYWAAVPLTAAVALDFGFFALYGGNWEVALVVVLLFTPLILYYRPSMRLFNYARKCLTIRRARFSVHFPRELSDRVEREKVLDACQYDLDVLMKWFGVAPRKRIAVYLFAEEEEIGRIFGSWYGGVAHPRFHFILVPISKWFRGILRHELGHICSLRLGPMAPHLKSEGLAVFFQCDGPPILSDVARRVARPGCLAALLKPRLFRDAATWRASYEIAGHFTDFLIQRFGKADYCASITRRRISSISGAVFERVFQIPLEQAEADWLQTIPNEMSPNWQPGAGLIPPTRS